MELCYKDKVYLITGATSGMGRGLAAKLLENNAKVVVNYAHNEDNANETRKLFAEYEDRVLFIKADISDENDVVRMYDEIKNKYGSLDGIVNNAVYDRMNSIEELTYEEYRRELEVNVIGRWLCTKYAIPLLQKSKCPRVINIASRLGSRPENDCVAYCTSEAATIMLTQCSALELTPKYGIKVNTISPSTTLTPLVRRIYSQEKINEMSEKNPSGRLGEVSDTVNAIMYLLSEEADYINGENLNVNGGILLR